MTRITITCEDCGHRHRLERTVGEPCMIWIVCHECELPIQAMFELPGGTEPVATAPTRGFEASWAGTLDLFSSGSAR